MFLGQFCQAQSSPWWEKFRRGNLYGRENYERKCVVHGTPSVRAVFTYKYCVHCHKGAPQLRSLTFSKVDFAISICQCHSAGTAVYTKAEHNCLLMLVSQTLHNSFLILSQWAVLLNSMAANPAHQSLLTHSKIWNLIFISKSWNFSLPSLSQIKVAIPHTLRRPWLCWVKFSRHLSRQQFS